MKDEPNQFKVGDKVQWTHVTSNGHSMRMTNREGVITEIQRVSALVKMRNGRLNNVHFDDLRLQGEDSALTAMFRSPTPTPTPPPAVVPSSIGTTLTCVYCGKAYPAGTPPHGEGEKVLTDHIKICERHPMRNLEVANQKLRTALEAFVGASTPGELNAMAEVIRAMPGNDSDRILALAAIQALLETT